MIIQHNYSLLDYNTFGLAVKADTFAAFESQYELQLFLQQHDLSGLHHLVVGCGSNLLFLNDFAGLVLHAAMQDVRILQESPDHVLLQVDAGVVWDELVAYCVDNAWYGIENLSLIPGECGAAALQNIGAYGAEIKDVVQEVHAVNIASAEVRVFIAGECQYGYRSSIFKNELRNQYIITSVVLKLSKKPVYNLAYNHLEQEVLRYGPITLGNVRKAVVAIRESKLPDPKIRGNAGSFFMNPVVSSEQFKAIQQNYPQMPFYTLSDDAVKIPAGWLIEQCGWKGKSVGNAGVHDKQALVLVNNGGATGAEIAHLAKLIMADVERRFGIQLVPEVNFIS